MRSLLLSCALLAVSPVPLRAQDRGLASLDELRARAGARGWERHGAGDAHASVETWCAHAPCEDQVDGFRFHIVDGALVELHLFLADAADGFSLDAGWQASGAFGFRFTHDDELIDLTYELAYEPPGLSVGFSARDIDEIVALDPADGTHAFSLWIARELARHLVSATSLRDTELAARRALRASVARGIATGGTIREGTFAEECFEERSTPQGTGIFDTCVMRMASADEQRAVLATLDARLRRERAILRGHSRAFHRVLEETLAAPPRH